MRGWDLEFGRLGQMMTIFVHCFLFLKSSLLNKLDFQCCLGDVCTATTRNRSLSWDFFLLCNSSLIFLVVRILQQV
jgi:hypothetical protein